MKDNPIWKIILSTLIFLTTISSPRSLGGRPLRVALVGDPQVDTPTELRYARMSIYRDLRERDDIDLVLVLGDLVNDRTELLAGSVSSLDSTGKSWLALPGNHDRDNRKGEFRGLEAWKKDVGYIDTAVVSGRGALILMNNVRTKGRADYEGGFSESQKMWLERTLKSLPGKTPVLLATHIPLSETEGLDTLASILHLHPGILSVSGHTHCVRRSPGPETLGLSEELVAGATCGSWWRGPKDSSGVPSALMMCGSPRGYFDLTVRGRRHLRLEFHRIGGGPQCSAHCSGDSLMINIFGGHTDGTVEVIPPSGKRIAARREDTPAPEIVETISWNRKMGKDYFRSHRDEFIPARRTDSPHVWVAPFNGGESVTIKYSDHLMNLEETVPVTKTY